MAPAPRDETLMEEERAAILSPSSCASRTPPSTGSVQAGADVAARKLERGIVWVASAGAIVMAMTLLSALAIWSTAAGGRRRSEANFLETTNLVKADVQLPPQPFNVGGMPPPISVGTPKSLLAESLLSALGARAEKVAPKMSPQDVASTLAAYVRLDAHPSPSLLTALSRRAKKVVPEMSAADVAKTLNAYARMHEHPGRDLWSVLEIRMQEVAGVMGPQDTADMLAALEFLGVQPAKNLMEAMRLRASQVASKMGAEAVAETMDSAAKMDLKGDTLWAALGHRANIVAKHFTAQDVANTLDAYSSLGKQPPKPLWTALGKRAAQVAPTMGVQDITHTLKAYAIAYEVLRRKPMDEMLVALGGRAEHLVDRMTSQDVADMLNSYAQLTQLAKRHGEPAEEAQALAELPQEPPPVGGEAAEQPEAVDSKEDSEVIEDEQHVEAAEKAGDTQAFPLPSGVVLSPQ